MSNKYAPIALLLLGIGLLLQSGDYSLPELPDWINPVSWFSSGPITVCIIEETKDRTHYDPGQVAVMDSVDFILKINESGNSFLGCLDQNVVDRNKQTPKDLEPYFAAASKVKLPALVTKKGSKYKAVELPNDEKKALEKIK